MSTPELVQLNPFDTSEVPIVLHTFPNALGLLGITETEPDIFVVISGNFSLTTVSSTPGSYTAWRVSFAEDPHGKTMSKVSRIADLTRASFINGITSLGSKQNAILMADSTLGVVFRLNLWTGEYEVVIDDPVMKATSSDAIEGINGLKVHGDHVYFTNFDRGLFARVPIYPNGTAASSASVVATARSPYYAWDDFAVDKHGVAYAAALRDDSITRITLSGESMTVAGNENSTDIAGPTSVAFGRTVRDRNTIYDSTGGGQAAPINGTVIIGGQLVAIDL